MANSDRYIHSYTENEVSAGIPEEAKKPAEIRPNSGHEGDETALHGAAGGRNDDDLAATVDRIAAAFPGASFLGVQTDEDAEIDRIAAADGWTA